MAAMWSLDIEKELGGETWTNRYILSNPSIESALLTAAAIWPIEQAVHLSAVTFTKYRITDLLPATVFFFFFMIRQLGRFTLSPYTTPFPSRLLLALAAPG